MKEKKVFRDIIEELCSCDGRYRADAYEFLMQALHFTQQKLEKSGHISGKELAQGVRDLAIQQFGPMAKTVLKHWGINSTADIGNIVFNLIGCKLLSKTETDTIEDFINVYDFDSAFSNTFGDIILRDVE